MYQCFQCQAGCCRANDVPLTGYDIIQISTILELTPFAFVDFIEAEPDRVLDSGEKEPRLTFTDRLPEKDYVARLKKIPSYKNPEIQKCFFLNEWIGTDGEIVARCGIYAIRPVHCAAWPAFLQEDKVTIKFRDIMQETKEFTPTHELYKLCRRNFSREDHPENTDGLTQTVLNEQFEKEFFEAVVGQWNKNPTTMDDFFGAIEYLYANRVIFKDDDDQK